MMKEQRGISERMQKEAALDTMRAGRAEAEPTPGIMKTGTTEAEPAPGITKAGTTEPDSGITQGEAAEPAPGQGGTTSNAQAQEQVKQSRGSVFEGIYDQLPDISVRSVDRFIIVCVIALAAVILIGVLKANHVF